jgi:hypothetical protein
MKGHPVFIGGKGHTTCFTRIISMSNIIRVPVQNPDGTAAMPTSGYVEKQKKVSVYDINWRRIGQFSVSKVQLVKRSTRLLSHVQGKLN